MSTFFDAVGVDCDQVAESLAEEIVQAAKVGGPSAVRLLVCRHVAQQLGIVLHIHTLNKQGQQPEVYEPQQQGVQHEERKRDTAQAAEQQHAAANFSPAIASNAAHSPRSSLTTRQSVHLARDAQELYHPVNSDGSSIQQQQEQPQAGGSGSSTNGGTAASPSTPLQQGPATQDGAAASGSAAGVSGGGGGGGSGAANKQPPRPWEERYAELHAFVQAHGQRPKRLASDHERQLYFWMALQQRNIREGKLSAGRAALIEPILAIRTVKRPSGAVSGRPAKQQRAQGRQAQQRQEQDSEEEEEQVELEQQYGEGMEF